MPELASSLTTLLQIDESMHKYMYRLKVGLNGSMHRCKDQCMDNEILTQCKGACLQRPQEYGNDSRYSCIHRLTE